MDDPAFKQFETLVAAAIVDGDLADRERQVLDRLAAAMNIPPSTVTATIDRGWKGKLTVAVPPRREEREAMLDDLIDLACADGRIEAPEHHLLAKFASHLGIDLPALRDRVKRRMTQKPSKAPKPEAARKETVARPVPKAVPARTQAPPPRGPAPASPELTRDVPPAPSGPVQLGGPGPMETSTAQFLPPGPIQLDGPRHLDPNVRDIPPVTLHLLKQSIAYDSEDDALRYIERMIGVARAEAKEVVAGILAAFPDVRPGSEQLRALRR